MTESDRTKTYKLVTAASRLSAEEAANLEAKVEQNSSDADSRILLLSYYWRRVSVEPEVEALHRTHLAWFVDNHPEHPITGMPPANVFAHQPDYADFRQRWLRQVELQKNNIDVLRNASKFFLRSEKDLAEDLLLKARQLEPDNLRIIEDLANLYDLRGESHALKAFQETEALLNLTSENEKQFYVLTKLVKRAFVAEQFKRAEELAADLLRLAIDFTNDWNYGNAIQQGHTILGMIALRKDDINEAKNHLLDSCVDAASPQTRSFGPDFDLAEALLGLGEKQTVWEYLDQCKLFCGVTHRRLIHLRVRIENPEMTDRDVADNHELCQQMEIREIEREPPSRRKVAIQSAIQDAESTVEIYSIKRDRTEEAEANRLKVLADSKLHLQRLREMLEQSE